MTEGIDTDMLWDEFHRVVNMTSEELRSYLLAEASGEEAFTAHPDLGVDELGRSVLDVLGKRKVDLTDDDVRVMRQVIDLVETVGDKTDDESRRVLMTAGHDPLRP